MKENLEFRQRNKKGMEDLFARLQKPFAPEDTLRIDLHCHDRNSDVPDETLGRILRVSETWLKTESLLETLRANGADVPTITNHNNARSCWECLDKGIDILVGAEFSCTLPDVDVGVHVLTFGFDPSQESKLNRLRKNLYRFLEYARREDIVTVLAHPLHFYSPGRTPSPALLDRFALLFERFEAVNGQRDSWQNLLTATWLESLDPERIEAIGKRLGIDPGTFVKNPFVKKMAGGSDCHMGLFAGATGTLLHVPNLKDQPWKKSKLALEALREGRMVPYGSYNEEEKLSIAFLDYFCQVALHMKDPGLIRMLLHRGSAREKLLALGIANGMMELRRHKYTTKFLGIFHEALQGKRPGFLVNYMTSRPFKPMLRRIEGIAYTRRHAPAQLVKVLKDAIPGVFHDLNLILAERIGTRTRELESTEGGATGKSLRDLIAKFELPSHFRALFGDNEQNQRDDITPLNVGKISDGLPFPFLASAVIGGAAFAGSRVLYDRRPFLNALAGRLGKFEHPRRILWLTDTFGDKNGVAHVLRSTLEEVRAKGLPIDFLTCNSEVESGDNLISLKPVAEFPLPFYRNQTIRIPDLLELQKVFSEGGYDRIICSTEAPMGLLALYLKHAFSVPAYFYVHTDWMDFAKRSLQFDSKKLDRLRRLLRTFYKAFDGLLVLNTEQREWLAGPTMEVPASKIFSTAHWVDKCFALRSLSTVEKSAVIPGWKPRDPVLLFVGRVSEEKGVMELPEIFAAIRKRSPSAHIVIAGTGPAEEKLKAALPQGIFLGWVDHGRLPDIYACADLMLFPSRFDTFGCSVLEAMSCSVPVIAYDTKGPRDLIQNGVNGCLGLEVDDLSNAAAALLESPGLLAEMKTLALQSASQYRPDLILTKLLEDMRMDPSSSQSSSSYAKAREEESEPIRTDGVSARREQSDMLDELLEIVGY